MGPVQAALRKVLHIVHTSAWDGESGAADEPVQTVALAGGPLGIHQQLYFSG